METIKTTEQYISVLDGTYQIPYSFFRDCGHITEQDIVIVGGTLVEGIGNNYSDIDVYIITDKMREKRDIDISNHHRVLTRDRSILKPDSENQEVFLIQTIYPETHIKVDFEYRTYTEMLELFSRIDEIFDYAKKNLILLTKRVLDRDESILHRIFNCIPIQNTERFGELLNKFDKMKYCYVAYRWVASDFSVLFDIIGAWQKKEYDRAVELARQNMITQTMGYLHIIGVTNTDPKWQLTYLNSVAEVNDKIRKRFMNLYFMDGVSDDVSKIAYIKDTLDLVDDIYRESVPYLEGNQLYPSGQTALDILQSDLNDAVDIDEFKALEYAYRARAYGKESSSTVDCFTDLV